MKAKIRLAFRITIGQNPEHLWDQYVFEDTYQEYRIQHQVFNSKENPVNHYWELLAQNPAAHRIPFLLSASAENYVKQLNGEIKSLPDALGNRFFKFENYKLDIVNAHLNDASKFKIGITFFSGKLLLIDIIDNKFLLSENLNTEEILPTFMFPFHQQVSICEYEKMD
ncbi:MAG: hypothetical protein QM564_11405 [Bergeyella sp.]